MIESDNIALYGKLFKMAHERIAPAIKSQVESFVKVGAGMDPATIKNMLLVGGGMAAGAIPTYLIKNHLDEVRRQRSIDRSFGAGVATGFAGPALIKALTQSLGQPQMMQAAPQQPQYPLLMDTPNA